MIDNSLGVGSPGVVLRRRMRHMLCFLDEALTLGPNISAKMDPTYNPNALVALNGLWYCTAAQRSRRISWCWFGAMRRLQRRSARHCG